MWGVDLDKARKRATNRVSTVSMSDLALGYGMVKEQ